MATVFNHRFVAGSFLWSVVVTGCVSQGSYDSLQAENTQLQQTVEVQSNQLATQQAELSAQREKTTRLQSAIKYTIDSDQLFPTGSWEMSAEGKKIIARMAKKLAPTQENKIVVNGYTDDTPIGPDLENQGVTSNQVLSEKRAEAVKEFLISQGVARDLVKAVGHGDSHPVAKNDTAKGRQQNRRVELSLGG